MDTSRSDLIDPCDCSDSKQICGEIDGVKELIEAKERAERKVALLRKRHEEELNVFNETRVENIFKNSGAREYIERLKERNKVKDDLIRDLKEELEFKTKEIAELEERNREAKKQLEEYIKAWKGAHLARESLEGDKKAHLIKPIKRSDSRNRNPTSNLTRGHSSASSVVDNLVPPPPMVEPSVDEILQGAQSTTEDNTSFRSVDATIPPPPPMDFQLDEIMNIPKKRAFEQDEGQFLCHAYVDVSQDLNKDAINQVIDVINDKQSDQNNCNWRPWTAITSQVEDGKLNPTSHITLIRGHRAIYYHQIKPLVEILKRECDSTRPFSILLDRLEIFHNREKNKQFLCMAVRPNQVASQLEGLKDLKRRLRSAVDLFAIRLTGEDETEDTLAHCSLMSREIAELQAPDQLEAELEALDFLLSETLDEFPDCLVRVEEVHVRIGDHVYKFRLNG